ncbi:hypothetical protein FACS1894162_1530 [Bacteroidia bacterium]|nr:hypothetical protein FACS1894162_1530 [Bacteroidia bacterium]
MKNKYLIGCLLCCLGGISSYAQPNLYSGTQNRIVVFARFNGDPDVDTPQSQFEAMFNAEEGSLKSYFKAISNDKLTVQSLLYPQNTGSRSFELKYCYYCYDNTWKGNYPNCKGSDITSLFDINIGFIIQDLASKLEVSESLPDASALDSDNDGCVDNFVIVFRGAGRGLGRGIYTPQTGSITSSFTSANGEIQIKGKTVKNYTITFERNSLETHCRFMLASLGFPVQYRNSKSLPRSVGAWDPMDGPLLSYPLVYNRMKYSNGNWIANIPAITETGVYSLSPANSAGNNAYKLVSSDPTQFWILEYRNRSAGWEENLPESGLLIYRVNTNYTGSITANPEVYLYRKDGTPTTAGEIQNAAFSNSNGRTVFDEQSNPYAFLSNGNISDEINISDITFNGEQMTFRVNKAHLNLSEIASEEWDVQVDAEQNLHVRGEGVEQVLLFNLAGQNAGVFILNGNKYLALPAHCAPGVYIAQMQGKLKNKSMKLIVR